MWRVALLLSLAVCGVAVAWLDTKNTACATMPCALSGTLAGAGAPSLVLVHVSVLWAGTVPGTVTLTNVGLAQNTQYDNEDFAGGRRTLSSFVVAAPGTAVVNVTVTASLPVASVELVVSGYAGADYVGGSESSHGAGGGNAVAGPVVVACDAAWLEGAFVFAGGGTVPNTQRFGSAFVRVMDTPAAITGPATLSGTSVAEWGATMAALEPTNCFPATVPAGSTRFLSSTLTVPPGFLVSGTLRLRRHAVLTVSGDMIVDGGTVQLGFAATLSVQGTLTTRNNARFIVAVQARLLVQGTLVAGPGVTFAPSVASSSTSGTQQFTLATFVAASGPLTVAPAQLDMPGNACLVLGTPAAVQTATTLSATVAVTACSGGLSVGAIVGIAVAAAAVAVAISVLLVALMVRQRRAANEHLRERLLDDELRRARPPHSE